MERNGMQQEGVHGKEMSSKDAMIMMKVAIRCCDTFLWANYSFVLVVA